MSEERQLAFESELRGTDMSGTPNITPNEIRNAAFNTTMRGFNRNEVDEFLQNSATSLENALSETAQLRGEHEQLQQKYQKLAAMEDSLKSTMLEAQKTADSMRANAQRDVELALERARGKQQLIEEQTQVRLAELQEKVRELDTIRLDYQEKIRHTIESHLKIVSDIEFSANLPDDGREYGLPEFQETAIEPAEIESSEVNEASVFEADSSETEVVAEVREIPEIIENVESESHDPVSDTLHAEMTSLADADAASEPEQIDNNVETQIEAQLEASDESSDAPSVSESIAQAVEDKEHDSSSDQNSDDNLYKKLVTDEVTKVEPEYTIPAVEERSQSKATSKVQSGSDGIVVFGRKEDREKSMVENARILSELDSVVDKFAEELREIDSK